MLIDTTATIMNYDKFLMICTYNYLLVVVPILFKYI